MDQDDLFSHPVDTLGDSVVPDLDLEPVALSLPGKIFRQRPSPLPEHLPGFAPSGNPERLKFMFEIMETEIEQVPFILLPLQVVVAEPRDLHISDLQGERLDEDRVRLIFLEIWGLSRSRWASGEHLLHRLEGQGGRDDKRQLLLDRGFFSQGNLEELIENQGILLDTKRSNP